MKTTDWLAIYGAALSTFVFLWNARQSRPRVKVRIVPGVEDGVFGAHISIQNRSPHTVHLANVSILYRYKTVGFLDWISHAWEFKRFPRRLGWVHSALSNHGLDDECPVALAARDAHHLLVPEEVLEEIFEKSVDRSVMAVAQDKMWNDVYSEVLVFTRPKISVSEA